MIRAYENLIQAIVLQAVKDWRKAVRKLKKYPRYVPARQMKDECEDFFLSDWFTTLTDADGSHILRKLKQEENIYDDERISPAGLSAGSENQQRH